MSVRSADQVNEARRTSDVFVVCGLWFVPELPVLGREWTRLRLWRHDFPTELERHLYTRWAVTEPVGLPASRHHRAARNGLHDASVVDLAPS